MCLASVLFPFKQIHFRIRMHDSSALRDISGRKIQFYAKLISFFLKSDSTINNS